MREKVEVMEMFVKLTKVREESDNEPVWINVNYILEVRQRPEGGTLIDECGFAVTVEETADQVMALIARSGFQKDDRIVIVE